MEPPVLKEPELNGSLRTETPRPGGEKGLLSGCLHIVSGDSCVYRQGYGFESTDIDCANARGPRADLELAATLAGPVPQTAEKVVVAS